MRLFAAAVFALAYLLVVGTTDVASARPADPETPALDVLIGTNVQLDPGVPHRLSPATAAIAFLRYQPDAHIDSLRLLSDEAAACEAEPRLGCPVSHGRGPIWLIEASGLLRYCPRNGSAPCPLFARRGLATIGDHSGTILGFGIWG
jgi:hypothetical protein